MSPIPPEIFPRRFNWSPFEKSLERWKLKGRRIPSGRESYSGDVEAFACLLEEEFFDHEDSQNPENLLGKSDTSMKYVNLFRVNH